MGGAGGANQTAPSGTVPAVSGASCDHDAGGSTHCVVFWRVPSDDMATEILRSVAGAGITVSEIAQFEVKSPEMAAAIADLLDDRDGDYAGAKGCVLCVEAVTACDVARSLASCVESAVRRQKEDAPYCVPETTSGAIALTNALLHPDCSCVVTACRRVGCTCHCSCRPMLSPQEDVVRYARYLCEEDARLAAERADANAEAGVGYVSSDSDSDSDSDASITSSDIARMAAEQEAEDQMAEQLEDARNCMRAWSKLYPAFHTVGDVIGALGSGKDYVFVTVDLEDCDVTLDDVMYRAYVQGSREMSGGVLAGYYVPDSDRLREPDPVSCGVPGCADLVENRVCLIRKRKPKK